LKAWFKKHPLAVDTAITILISVIMLTIMEIRQPYFFLQDDNCDSYICQYVHSLRSVTQGEFPLYNFHQLGGISFLGKGQTGQLNLFVYIGGALSKLFLGHLCGTVDAVAWLYLIAGAIGMLILLEKVFSLSRVASITGAIAWSFNSFSIYCGSNWIIAIILTGTMPWIVLGTNYLMNHKGIKALIIAAIPKVFLFYGGHPQYFVYAVLFDYIFVLSRIFIDTPKGSRAKAEGKFTLNYFFSGLLVTLWSLPLLGPMWGAMNDSVDRSGKLIFGTFINNKYRLGDFVLGIFLPILKYDITDSEFIEDGIEVGIIDTIDAIQKNMSHFGYILLIAFILGIVHLILKRSDLRKSGDNVVKKTAVCVPGLIIAFLWATSGWFNRIIFFIPVLNRFRYPFKLMQFALFFMIIIAAVMLSYIFKELLANKNRIKNILSAAFPLIECINLLALYLVLPVRYFGVYTVSAIPFEEPFYDNLAGARYVTLMDAPDYWDKENNLTRTGYDTAATLAYNYATYYGLNNRSGYDLMMTEETLIACSDFIYIGDDICGDVSEPYENMVEFMRYSGVSYYVTLPENADYLEEYFEPYGITRCYDDGTRVIFYDALAYPMVYTSDGYALELDEHVNYLTVTTPDKFEGGSVTVNYTHNRKFIATVDGQETAITDPGDYSNMTVSGLSAGSHTITFRYVDNTFRNCLIVSLAGTVILAAAVLIKNSKRKI